MKKLPIYRKPVSALIKAGSDRLLALLALLVLWPVMALAALGIVLSSPGPVIYKAQRMGRYGIPFTIYKFRTMRVGADKEGAITAAQDSRVFAWGKLLRSTKIDELPQLFNILKGEMSIVGPRPEDVEIVLRAYTSREMQTLDVLPGLSCPGSIFYYTHGENWMSGDDTDEEYTKKVLHVKLALDLYYLRHWSPAYDVDVILRTVQAILATSVFKKELDYPREYKKLKEKRQCRKKR